MNRRTRIRLAVVATPVLAALLYAALNWYTFEEVSVRVGLSEEARREPFLAYARLLARLGARTEIFSRPAQLDRPPEGGVLLLGSYRLAFMSPERVRTLVAWVERGGTLVVEAEPPIIRDPLLEAFGVGRPKPARERARTPPSGRDFGEARFEWPAGAGNLRVELYEFSPGLEERRAHAGRILVRVGARTPMIAFESGRGRVVAVTTLGFLHNTRIDKADHAEFGWRMARIAGEAPRVVLFIRPQSPSLWSFARANAWAALVAGVVLLAVWLARIVPRFGPLAPADAPPRRSLVEHVAASGRYLWARKESAHLLQALRERVLRLAERRGVRLARLAEPGATELLSRRTGIAPGAVRRAFATEASSGADFISATATLQSLENALAAGPGRSLTARAKAKT